MGENITVSWINHHQTLLDALWKCFLDKHGFDLEITCQDRVVGAHQLILESCCPSIRKTLEAGQTEKCKPAIRSLKWDMAGDDADRIVEFMYRGEILLTEDRLIRLKKAAQDFEFQGLLDALNSCKHPSHGTSGGGVSRKGAKKRKGKPIKIPNKKSGDHFREESKGSANLDSEGNETDYDEVQINPKGPKQSPRLKRLGNNDDVDKTRHEGSDHVEDGCCGGQKSRKRRKQAAAAERKRRWMARRPVLRCSECEFETRDKNTLKSHQAKHDPNAERITCDVCNKAFRNRDSFRKHVRGHINPEKLLKCTHCDYHTVQRSSWIQHLAAIHQVDPQGNSLSADIKCPHCDSAFLTDCRLRLHIARKHTAIKSHKCPECDYATISKGEMDRHISRKHLNERPFMCETCGFRSKTRSAFNSHLVTHSGLKPFKCETCGQAYVRKDKLREHQKKHTREEQGSGCMTSQSSTCCCHLCGRVYYSVKEFTSHLQRCQGQSLEEDVDDEEQDDEEGEEDKKVDGQGADRHDFVSCFDGPSLTNTVHNMPFSSGMCYDQGVSRSEDPMTLFY